MKEIAGEIFWLGTVFVGGLARGRPHLWLRLERCFKSAHFFVSTYRKCVILVPVEHIGERFSSSDT